VFPFSYTSGLDTDDYEQINEVIPGYLFWKALQLIKIDTLIHRNKQVNTLK
jgi:hypothetical protein